MERCLDTVNLLVGAVVDGNLVWNWGREEPGCSGVAIAFTGVGGCYSLLSVCGNRLLIDADGAQDGLIQVNGQVGISFTGGALTSLEWAQVDHNLIFGAAEGIRDPGVLGPTVTRNGNMVKLLLR
jgi:hypothetical protein